MKNALSLVAIVSLASSAIAQTSGTWTNLSGGNASGTWTNPANWSGGTIAGGSGYTADFSTLDITVDSTVTLGTSVTIGNLTFGDTATNSAAGWILGNGGNTLTLAGTTPTITVGALGAGKSVTLNAQVLGTSGLIKTGLGRLVLNNSSNSYTGSISNANMTVTNFGSPLFSTVVQHGRLVLGSGTAAGTGNILVKDAGISTTGFLDLNGNTVSNNIGLNGDTYLYNSSTSTASSMNGNVWIRNYGRIGSPQGEGAGTVIVNGNLNFYFTNTSLYAGSGGSLVVLNGSANQGIIYVQNGTLRAQDGANINTNSQLRLGFVSGTHYGGIWESKSNITRSIGDGPGLISVGYTNTTNTNVGFSAYGGPITVALGGTSAPTPLVWGQTNFLEGSSTLVLNAATADSTLTFANSLDFNGQNRTIAVYAATAHVGAGISNGTLTKAGAGTLVLAGSNTLSGVTTISGGTLRTTLESFSGNVTNNGLLILNQTNDTNFAGAISGTGGFEKAGSGTLTLTASNSYTGTTTVSGGLLKMGSSNALGASSGGVIVAAGATLDPNGINLDGKVVTIAGSGIGGNGALANNATSSITGLRLALSAGATIGGTARMDTAYNGTIINGGTNTLTKTGTNQFTINSGTTTLGEFYINQGGVVVVNSGTGLGDTNYGTYIASGASLGFFNNTGSAIANSENITLAGGAELSSSVSTNANTLNGTITLSSSTVNVRVEPGVGMILGGVITGGGGINKISSGTLEMKGTNTYSGNTTITGGTLTVSEGAQLRFVIGANGVNNAVSGSGNFNANGRFTFDLSGASTTTGHSWTIVAPEVNRSYGTNFFINGFNGAGGNWTNTTNGTTYVFTQSNNVLKVLSSSNNYNSWVSYWQGINPGFTNTSGTADPDGDGFSNNLEFAFDGNPSVGTPALMTATKSGSNTIFNWVQRKNPPGGVTYQMKETASLATGPWTNASVTISNAPDQSGLNIPADYERKQFVVPVSSRNFYRVEATILP